MGLSPLGRNEKRKLKNSVYYSVTLPIVCLLAGLCAILIRVQAPRIGFSLPSCSFRPSSCHWPVIQGARRLAEVSQLPLAGAHPTIAAPYSMVSLMNNGQMLHYMVVRLVSCLREDSAQIMRFKWLSQYRA
jgi:hypothetical protein